MAKVLAENFLAHCLRGGSIVSMLVPVPTLKRVRQQVCRSLNLDDDYDVSTLVQWVRMTVSASEHQVRMHLST
jgi:hypothetical protein